MILTTHALVGSSLTNLFPNNPMLGFGLAFASHYIIDTIPHKDYNIDHFLDKDSKSFKSVLNNLKSALGFLLIGADFLIGIILSVLIFARGERSLFITALGICGGVLPDVLQFLYYKFKKKPWLITQKIHYFFHSPNEMKDKPFFGVLNQILCSISFILIYFIFK